MKENDMDAEFFRGLFLYVLIVSSPIIAAWMWKKRQDRKARLNMVRYIMYKGRQHPKWIVDPEYASFGSKMSHEIRDDFQLATKRQKRKDDHIFNVVEEYRNVSS
jgi:hypothetical protein